MRLASRLLCPAHAHGGVVEAGQTDIWKDAAPVHTPGSAVDGGVTRGAACRGDATGPTRVSSLGRRTPAHHGLPRSPTRGGGQGRRGDRRAAGGVASAGEQLLGPRSRGRPHMWAPTECLRTPPAQSQTLRAAGHRRARRGGCSLAQHPARRGTPLAGEGHLQLAPAPRPPSCPLPGARDADSETLSVGHGTAGSQSRRTSSEAGWLSPRAGCRKGLSAARLQNINSMENVIRIIFHHE